MEVLYRRVLDLNPLELSVIPGRVGVASALRGFTQRFDTRYRDWASFEVMLRLDGQAITPGRIGLGRFDAPWEAGEHPVGLFVPADALLDLEYAVWGWRRETLTAFRNARLIRHRQGGWQAWAVGERLDQAAPFGTLEALRCLHARRAGDQARPVRVRRAARRRAAAGAGVSAGRRLAGGPGRPE